MKDIPDDDFEPEPPSARRVAARALILAAISCRALIEDDAAKDGAEELRASILPWLESIGTLGEAESSEVDLIATPLGALDDKRGLNVSWRSEGMAALAWVLNVSDLPPVNIQCEPSDVANCLGFLDDAENTPIQNPRLRDAVTIKNLTNTYLTLHWRLRQHSLAPSPIDFVAYASACTWANMRLDDLEIVDRDLAIDGVRIDRVSEARYHEVCSITQERHQALNWLMGFEELYSQVTTDT